MKKTCILGIETSCDETSVALVENGRNVLVQETASSMALFETIGGVIPEEAAREQVKCMIPVLQKVLKTWGKDPSDFLAIAVTKGPGLLGSLLVGTMTARVIADSWNIPLIGVHHILGHLSSPWLCSSENEADPEFPLLALSVSGGHSELWLRTSHTHGTLLSKTRDDAAGEAFDKGAELLGLPYPGGPALSALASSGSDSAFAFPLPLKGDPSMDFSFSGLKTALRYQIRDLKDDAKIQASNLAASYEAAICAHILDRLANALEAQTVREVHLVGGVSANSRLQKECRKLCDEHNCTLRVPASEFRTDNAAMIAAAAGFMHEELGKKAFEPFETMANLETEHALI